MAGYFVFLTLLVSVLAVASGRRNRDAGALRMHNALRNIPNTGFRGHGHGMRGLGGLDIGTDFGRNMHRNHGRRFDRTGNSGGQWTGLDVSPITRGNSESRPDSSHHRRMLERMTSLLGGHGQGRGMGHGRGHRRGHHRGYADRLQSGLGENMRFTSHSGHPRWSASRHRGNKNIRGGVRGRGQGSHGSRFRHHMNMRPDDRVPGVRALGHRGTGGRLGPRYTVTR